MTLTTRLLVFFLATLAAVLVGFSLAVYGLAGRICTAKCRPASMPR